MLEGEGIKKTLANTLQPGESARLNADLAPGTYTIYCPVGEGAHRAQGMELESTVTRGVSALRDRGDRAIAAALAGEGLIFFFFFFFFLPPTLYLVAPRSGAARHSDASRSNINAFSKPSGRSCSR